MKIRTQLIIAAFVLAVVPLAAIVTYTHHTSRLALESAYRREADRLTGQMDRRLAAIRADLDRRLTFVSALPIPSNATREEVRSIVTVMGESASFVDALEFQPVRAPAPEAPAPKVGAAAPEPESPVPPERMPHEVPVAAGTHPIPAVPFIPEAPMVIEIPENLDVPHYVMSEEQKELLGEISSLGAQLGNLSITAEEREDLVSEMKAAQAELHELMTADRDRRQAELRAAQREIHRRQVQNTRVARSSRLAAIAAAAPVPAIAPAAPTPAPSAAPVAVAKEVAPPPAAKVRTSTLTKKEIADAEAKAKKASLIFGRKFETPVRKEGEVVGQLTARVSPEEVLNRVLGSAGESQDGSEIPFAVDREGTIYTRQPAQKARLEQLGIADRLRKGQSVRNTEGWIVSTSADPQSGLRFGVARPVGESFDDLRRTAARNFGLGMGLIFFALIGIVPLSNHLSRDVKLITEGAERIAQGDLMTRLPVRTQSEIGQLARAFNRMAEDLSINQQMLLEQERARREQEMQQRLLALEYERKTIDLEDARRFQLSMLPKEVPKLDSYEIAVYTRTATEVGGDYYDFHHAGDGLAITIGDATGHGARAGTMVTVIKTLFAGYDAGTRPAEFLRDSAEKIKRMDLGRMAMALSLARLEGRRLTVASAGMPPVLVHRAADSSIEEVAIGATPLGTLGTDYSETSVELREGDTVLFQTDGFPELMNDLGQQLGYEGANDAFSAAAKAPNAEGVIAGLAEAARRWHGEAPPNDDVTFVVVRA